MTLIEDPFRKVPRLATFFVWVAVDSFYFIRVQNKHAILRALASDRSSNPIKGLANIKVG